MFILFVNYIEIQLEILKQDRLRNNIRLTGLPPQAFVNPTDTVIRIINTVQMNLLPSDFVAYSDRKKSSIIITFDKHSHKRHFMDLMRKRKTLLVEEILQVQSKSPVYCNDHLTQYFSAIFQKAWIAKKNKQLFSASSLGGRIKVRKFENSNLVIVETESQLCDIIGVSHLDESSPNRNMDSPNSLSNAQEPQKQQQSEQLQAHTEEFSQSNAQNQPPHTYSLANPNNQRDPRDSNRSAQWQGMRYNPNSQPYQPKHNNRSKQQDIGRRLDSSPNQRSYPNNLSTYQNSSSFGSYHNSYRNYSQEQFNG